MPGARRGSLRRLGLGLRWDALGRHAGYDRVTFTFDNFLPGYVISYVDPPISEDGSGKTVNVAGSDYVQVLMQPASGFDLNSGEGKISTRAQSASRAPTPAPPSSRTSSARATSSRC